MIDFSNIKQITIPEGNVTKIICDGETLWESPIIRYSISYTITNATLSNKPSNIIENEPYTSTITTTNGHQAIVTVIMGEIDITNSAYDGNVTINIPAVTGNIVITVSETIINWLPIATDTDRSTIYNGIGYYNGKRWSSSGNKITTGNNTTSITGFIPCKPGDTIRIQNYTKQSGTAWYIVTFDSNQTRVVCKERSGNSPSGAYVSPGYSEYTLDSATYGEFTDIRLSWGQFNADSIITINQAIPS